MSASTTHGGHNKSINASRLAITTRTAYPARRSGCASAEMIAVIHVNSSIRAAVLMVVFLSQTLFIEKNLTKIKHKQR